MIQKLKSILLTFLGTSLLLAPAVAMSSPVFADGKTDSLTKICTGVDATGKSSVNASGTDQCQRGNGTTDNDAIVNFLRAAVNILSVVVGIVAVIMIIFAGFKYITSGGSQENVSGAKNSILYAIIGLVIVALAQIIVRFVINRALGAVTDGG